MFSIILLLTFTNGIFNIEGIENNLESFLYATNQNQRSEVDVKLLSEDVVSSVRMKRSDSVLERSSALNESKRISLQTPTTSILSKYNKSVGVSEVKTPLYSTDVHHQSSENYTNQDVTLDKHSTLRSPEKTEDIDVEHGDVDMTNLTLKANNITLTQEDTHTYYNSSVILDADVAKQYWVDLVHRKDAVRHALLSKSYRRAITVPLPFKFPFYGHEISNVTIATGGFLYTGDYIHPWLAATQYIAPLMANFDTSIANNSEVVYLANATSFTVLWANVTLQNNPSAGIFTFEVTLHSNGHIVFVYKDIPKNISIDMHEGHHPVKVGLSDAYIVDQRVFYSRHKTIFEYHRVNFDRNHLSSWMAIYLTPLPTCLSKTTCASCLAKDINFECSFCENRCSNGIDRHRQEWMDKSCDKKQITSAKYCQLTYPAPATKAGRRRATNPGSSFGGTLLTLLTITSILSFLVWIIYAYRNPHSTSGQMLIRYRPRHWSSWLKGEARYTAATTIHM